MQREDGHEDVSIQRRHYHERGVNTHDTYQHPAFRKLSEKKTSKRNRFLCSTSQTLAIGSEKKLCRQRRCRVYDEKEENAALESSRNA